MNAVLSSLSSIGLFNTSPFGDNVDVTTIAFVVAVLWALFVGLLLGFWRGRSLPEPPDIQWPIGHALYKPQRHRGVEASPLRHSAPKRRALRDR